MKNALRHIKPINYGMPLCELMGSAAEFGDDFSRPVAGNVHVINGSLEETLANVRGLKARTRLCAQQLKGSKARKSEVALFLKELAEDLAVIERQVIGRLNGAANV